jgi:hypothetical protein
MLQQTQEKSGQIFAEKLGSREVKKASHFFNYASNINVGGSMMTNSVDVDEKVDLRQGHSLPEIKKHSHSKLTA